MDWWLSVGLCGVVFEPCALKSCVDVLTVYGIRDLLVGKNTVGDYRACLASGFLFCVYSLRVSLLLTCGLYEYSACHLSY
jgi:hypothetical protein